MSAQPDTRQDYRQHSKSTLIRAARIAYMRSLGIEAALRRTWRRRVVAAALLAFVLGLVAGAAVGSAATARGYLTSFRLARILDP